MKTRASLIFCTQNLQATSHTAIYAIKNANAPQAGRKNGDCNVKIEEKREPSGRLMLRNGCDDRNVNLCIAYKQPDDALAAESRLPACIPEGVEAARPRRDVA